MSIAPTTPAPISPPPCKGGGRGGIARRRQPPLRHFVPLLWWDLLTFFRRPATYALLTVTCLIAGGSFAWLIALLTRGTPVLKFGDDPVVQFLGPNVFLVGTVTLLVPLLTMNVVVDERRRGTWDLWWLSGVGRGEWLFARTISAWLQLLLCLSPWFVFVLVLRTPFDPGAAVGAAIGWALIGLTLIVAGILVSAACRTPLAAATVTLAVLFGMLAATVVGRIFENSSDHRLASVTFNLLACWRHQELFSQGSVSPVLLAGHLSAVLAIGWITWRVVLDPPRFWAAGLREALWGLPVAAALLGLNFAAAAYLPATIDLTSRRAHSLAPQTTRLLQSLKPRVEISILCSPDVRTAADRQFQPVIPHLRELFARCREIQPALVLRELDAHSAAGRALNDRYPDALPPCAVVVAEDGAGSQYAVLSVSELVTYHHAERKLAAVEFHAEQALTAALARLAADRRPTLIALPERHCGFPLAQGTDRDNPIQPVEHVSNVPALQHDGNRAPRSIARAAARLQELGCGFQSVDLDRSPFPTSTSVALIAGPSLDWSPQEISRLRTWLLHGGRALVLLEPNVDPHTGRPVQSPLDELLAELGVDPRLGSGVVPIYQAIATTAQPLSGDHPLLRTLPPDRVALYDARPLEARRSAGNNNTRVIPLLHASASPAGLQDIVAVAIERHGQPMLVVVGDSEFLADRAVESAGGRAGFGFALSALNWLRDRPDRWGDIPVERHEAYRLPGTADDHRGLVWKPLLVMIALTLTAAALAWTRLRQG